MQFRGTIPAIPESRNQRDRRPNRTRGESRLMLKCTLGSQDPYPMKKKTAVGGKCASCHASHLCLIFKTLLKGGDTPSTRPH